jgi:hypothetical protein
MVVAVRVSGPVLVLSLEQLSVSRSAWVSAPEAVVVLPGTQRPPLIQESQSPGELKSQRYVLS